MNKPTRYLLVAAMVAAIGLIFWFPMGTIPHVVGYGLITTGMGVVYWAGVKNKRKNNEKYGN